MSEQTMVERINALGEYDGTADPREIIRDVWKVASTLLRGEGGEYCACQTYPCECVMRFMDDLAECVTTRHPGSRADAETPIEKGQVGAVSKLRTWIADEISSIQVGSGYESTTIGITAALEAADALIAAGVVTEEPDWEYGIYDPATNDVDTCGTDRVTHESFTGVRWEETGEYIVRRRVAGPWLPVQQEGEK
ncbi:hypothetical protein FGL91_18740 [Microbacterium sp. CBA3102]|uniref:hypothetical protein n=1 Tax=Microbacterium sp. CBA3102 TaxID=2603598 RepID=UPI0011BB27E2|nr:hypothetical protein [Microbacterium sp. CBA3102]QEA30405.1 hypothetical protein FGL91_18740 [Microbacterium sp. CBA3102]